MNNKNIVVLSIITLAGIYLTLLAVPVFKGDSATTQFTVLKEFFAEPPFKSYGLLNIIPFIPFIVLVITTILFILYISNKSIDNFKYLKHASLFLLGSFICDLAFKFFTLGKQLNSFTMVILVFPVLAFIFTYLVFWKPLTGKESNTPAPQTTTAGDEDKKLTLKDGVQTFILIMIIGGIAWFFNSNKKNVETETNSLKAKLLNWFTGLSFTTQMLLLFSLSVILSFFIVKEIKKRLLRDA